MRATELESWLTVVFAGAVGLAPLYAPPCAHLFDLSGAMPMRCTLTFRVVTVLAIAALLLSGALWLVRQRESRRALGGALALFGALGIVVMQPWVIGLCGSSSMACHRTAAWVWLFGTLLFVNGAWIAVRSGSRPIADGTGPRDPWDDSVQPCKGTEP